MVSPTVVAAPLTIVPAMGLLWLMLHRYEEYFVFTRVMFSLVAGFFAGIVVALFESQFDFAGPDAVAAMGLIPSAIMFVAGYAFFEAGGKTIMLGLSRFRKRKDTPFYAAAFGLGFGAMLALSLLVAAWRTAEMPRVPDYEMVPFLGIVALFVGVLMAHGGSTVWIGKGSAEGKLAKGWLQAAGLQLPALLFLRLSWPALGDGDETGFLGFAVLALLYGGALLAFADSRILANIVPPEIREMVRKEKRREAREAMRDDADEAPTAPKQD